ncbi:unnamed protein product [Lepeophtheirus salmonis]|uniref:(salmon louse) hypothetical protein n=1 Tax=Lepeophtheirus salmonis TaxID=72036 RepID=A0A7R8CCV1_LEPSM|nr:unnamed protein product [Lepeophtheirus salmonis]CAF2774940.1 unnamed protein product [Lepeophtheirus salmonis]
MSPIKTENVDSGVDIKTCTSPLAFTVNFDDTNEEEEDRKNNNNNCNTNNKRVLCLKDGITRFSSSCSSKKPLDMNKERRGEEVEDDDEGSDTGTYTIDDDEEIESKEDSWNDEKIPTSRDEDWISRWAEEQARQQQKIRHQQRRTTTSNNASPNAPPPFENSDENCRFRRKLPRLPSSNNSNDSKETEDLLKDTLSLVNAMEARIEDTASSLKNERLLRSSAPNKNTQDPKEIAKISELEAWKRRKKTIDPLLSPVHRPNYVPHLMASQVQHPKGVELQEQH